MVYWTFVTFNQLLCWFESGQDLDFQRQVSFKNDMWDSLHHTPGFTSTNGQDLKSFSYLPQTFHFFHSLFFREDQLYFSIHVSKHSVIF
ncbi:hypothetical protein AHF37_09797 [Paragonimus kellicotti]|nr:hypothetical protein AHF37_09797 [Paragonimus kellicotti]